MATERQSRRFNSLITQYLQLAASLSSQRYLNPGLTDPRQYVIFNDMSKRLLAIAEKFPEFADFVNQAFAQVKVMFLPVSGGTSKTNK